MTNYKFEIRYDGTRYYGWEHQPKLDTVQGKLEAVLEKLDGGPVEVIGAGRTDAGVHAKGMVANAKLRTDPDPDTLRDYMNRYLPEDICVTDARAASELFHARYKAVGKLYTYTFWIGPLKPVFDRKFVTVLDKEPDLPAMREAAAYLIGTHDYTSFCGNPRYKRSCVRTVDSIEIVRRKSYLYLNFHGSGFLQNMVRIMTGTLLQAGNGEIEPAYVKEILEGRNRYLAGPMAPAQGLCLMKVDY